MLVLAKRALFTEVPVICEQREYCTEYSEIGSRTGITGYRLSGSG
jgi:hypothetical protein